MKKAFEDVFSKIQIDMVQACYDYADCDAEKIYVYASCEDHVISPGFFFKINGRVLKRHLLNQFQKDKDKYDVSPDNQGVCLDRLTEKIKELVKVCKEYEKPMPTEIKLIYDVVHHKLRSHYEYEPMYSFDEEKTADDMEDEWYEQVKREEESSLA